jgi:penicillin-binding protein 2
LAFKIGPADARRRPSERRPPAGWRSSALTRRRHWFKPSRRLGDGIAAWLEAHGQRLRHVLRPVRINRQRRTQKTPRRRPPAQPRMRPKRSVVDRVMPGGEPSPPRTIVRLRVVGLLVAVLFSLMFVRLWYLQVLDTSSYTRTVTANQLRPVEIPAPRGLILDRTGQTMVGDQVTEDITLSRVSAQQHPSVVAALSTLLGITPAQIQADLANPQYSLYKPVPIMENAPVQDVLYIGEHASQFPGVSTVADTSRTYPLGTTGAQMLGYTGEIQKLRPGYQLGDQVGLNGLEAQYEPQLRGTPGIERVEVDAHGDVVGNLGETTAVPGEDLVTNIDAGLQQTLQQALDAEAASVGSGKGGAAVALDPQTGAVLALVSSPSYDPSWWTPNGITEAHYQQLEQTGSLNNNVTDGLYTPGSTFKLATATAALNEGLISPGYVFDDTGAYTIPGCAAGGAGCATYHDNEGEAAGAINITQALTVSSDIFFYNLGVQFWDQRGHYGETPIQDAANALGYGQVTGIDLPGETRFARVDSPQVVAREHAQNPAVYPNGQWFTGNNLEMAFGQGGTVITPLEQAVAYATFADGGTRYAPEIGAGYVDSTGKVVGTIAPKVTGHVAYSPANYQAMLNGFIGAVQSQRGTAYGAFAGFPLGTFPLAGKTGTATTNEQQPNSWFVGWGPLPSPRYLIAAVVEGGGYGASAAAPVVRQGFDYLVAHPETAPRLALPPSGGATACPAPGATSSSATGSSASSTTTTTSPGSATTTTVPCPPAGSATTTAYRVSVPTTGGGGRGGGPAGGPSALARTFDRTRAPPGPL